jgi:hypothetical protein
MGDGPTDVGRVGHHRTYKLTSTSTLRRLGSQTAGEQPPADLDIDTEHSDLTTSADRIVEHFGLSPAHRTTATQIHQAVLQNDWTGIVSGSDLL